MRDAVLGEPVSGSHSLLCGNLQGKIRKLISFRASRLDVTRRKPWFTGNIPIARNRELVLTEQGINSVKQGSIGRNRLVRAYRADLPQRPLQTAFNGLKFEPEFDLAMPGQHEHPGHHEVGMCRQHEQV